MKIAIVGTHGTGKSTLSYLLASHYKKIGKNVKIVQEVARTCPFPINEGMTREAAMWIYHEHSRKELEATSMHEIVIGDRSIYDSFVYAEYFKIPVSGLVDIVAFNKLREYDRLIFIRPDIPLQTDGTRSSDLQFQKGVDSIFAEKMNRISHIQVQSSQIFDKGEAWKHYCL